MCLTGRVTAPEMDLGAASLCSRAICRYMATSSGLRDTRQLLLNQEGSCTQCEQEAANATDRYRHTVCQLTAWLLQHNQLTEATPSLPGLPCVQQCGDEWIVAQPVGVCGEPNTVNVMTPLLLRAAERGTHSLDDALDVRASQVVTEAVLCKAIQVQVTECKHIQTHRQTPSILDRHAHTRSAMTNVAHKDSNVRVPILDLVQVCLSNGLASLQVWHVHKQELVHTPSAAHSVIESVQTVGGTNHKHIVAAKVRPRCVSTAACIHTHMHTLRGTVLPLVHAIHLCQDLVDNTVVGASTLGALLGDRVELVEEDDARRGLACRLEHLANL